jgi:hypothetical protein
LAVQFGEEKLFIVKDAVSGDVGKHCWLLD